jgi:hypothetical protein
MQVYVFKNIRYASPPVGPLRFAKPIKPTLNRTLSDGSYGPQCIQSLQIQQIPEIDLAGLLNLGDSFSVLAPLLGAIQPLIVDLGMTGSVDTLVAKIRPYLAPGGALSGYTGTIGDLLEALSGVVGAGQGEDCK